MDLKPCPFCLADEKMTTCSEFAGRFFIDCAMCGAQGPVAGDEETAAQLWDERKGGVKGE